MDVTCFRSQMSHDTPEREDFVNVSEPLDEHVTERA